ncbi:MAG: polya polymerase, partial [Desulfobacterales bacterium]|nr:polya polymerase [Desulfobacterales bacterium]
ICRRLELAPRYRSILCQERFEADRRLIQLERNLPETNDRLYHKLTGFKTELILYMMAATSSENVQKAISHFFTNLRRVRISVMGRDLLEFGLKPGPVFKTILDAALNARLNGRLKTLDDEKNFVREYISHLTT